jgi:hypothetical protein
MGLEAIWQRILLTGYEVWLWLRYEMAVHPYLLVGVVIVAISAWVLYKAEVRTK